MQNITNIKFQNIGNIPESVKDFLNFELNDYNFSVFSPENVKQKIKSKSEFFNAEKRNLLFEVLKNQHSDSQLSENQKFNIDSILLENTFTVTTGHQLNLFSGPVFSIYKIIQTIKLAEFLKTNFPENHFVPVFWMASEDHDFEEINHFKTKNHLYKIEGKSGGAVGKIKIEDEHFISDFENEFKNSAFGNELISMMKHAYKTGNTLSEATRILFQELFSDSGLLILDGDSQALKSEMKPIFREELLNQNLHRFSKNNVDFIKNKYGKVQVNPREINLFYLSETRNRIEKKGNQYKILDTETEFSESEILEALEKHPEKFSPNALLRPVYQEFILPNLVYVGGNAEILYWLELKDYFEKIGLGFPVLVPRNSMLFISEKSVLNIEKFGFEPADFLKNFDEFSKDFLLKNNKIKEILDQKENALKLQFSDLKNIAERTDKTFGNMVSAEEKRQLKSFERMKKRLLRAEKIKHREKLEQLKTLFHKIHPEEKWQERVLNFSVFYANFGKNWLKFCYEKMPAEKSELVVSGFGE
ncbi:MAG: bacillithiol biosynthesis cysteine-adding enzyme BshC [Flavobacteriaceae bacterium]|jgi:bacillithiol biosynthesis cysteine-adding enzyme BshC|nr:bacillithiol biosynthesis cysteine-adding enzyme BshC [Flavobacteriaceae bacterium]